MTEALTTGGADAHLGTVLRTARAAHRAGRADQDAFALLGQHMINPQMATALAHPTTGACHLAGMADRVTADRTGADVLGAGPFATCPAELTTGVTVLPPAGWTGGNPTGRAEQILTTLTLL